MKEIHDLILPDLDRELAQASVTTVLKRLVKKGWVVCHRQEKAFEWEPRISQQGTRVLQAHAQLNQFLAVGNSDVIFVAIDE